MAGATRRKGQLADNLKNLRKELALGREETEILDLTQDAFIVRDLEDRIAFWNSGARQKYRWTRGEALGQVSHHLLRTIFPVPLTEIKKALHRRSRWEGELRHQTRDGRSIVVASRWVLRRDKQGRPAAILEANSDITERKWAEEALRESEERYRRLFEDDLTGDCLATPEGKILTCNPAFLEIFGFRSMEEALDRNVATLYPDRGEYDRFIGLLRKHGKLERYECVRLRTDGTRISVVENAVGSFDGDGNLVEIKSYAFDDTERKRAEKALEEAKERYRLLVELIPDAVWVSDAEVVWFANAAAARLLGAAGSDELVGRPLLALFHHDDHAKIVERTRLAMERDAPLPLERRKIIRLDGQLVDVETTAGPCMFDGKKGVVRVSRDITERVQHEEELLKKDREISLHAERVEKLNTALRVLLEHREEESRRKDENIRATLDKLILPYLEGLKSTRPDEGQLTFIEIIEANLKDISASLARRLSTWHEKLTPTEIQVADLVLAGKRSKEIATLLRISESAVAFHRANIRAKLGLKNRAANLVSYLRSISKG